MSTVFNRMPDEVQFIIITGAFIVFLVAAIPHSFEKKAYRNTPSVNYEKYEDQAGYPAGEGFTDIKSVADMEELKNFTITVDVKILTPTHKYRSILDKSYYGKIMRQIQNSTVHGIGQYYTVVLESGEKIIVFVDDFAVDIPKSGTVTLPVAKKMYMNTISDTFREIQKEQQISEENISWYVDTTGNWRKSEQAKTIEGSRFRVGLLTFVLVAVIESILFALEKKRHA